MHRDSNLARSCHSRLSAHVPHRPYRIFQGRVAAGADADLIVWDATAKRTISHKTQESQSDFNIFEGKTCHGLPLFTVYNGRVVYENGKLSTQAGSGRYLPLPSHAPYVYSVIQQREKVGLFRNFCYKFLVRGRVCVIFDTGRFFSNKGTILFYLAAVAHSYRQFLSQYNCNCVLKTISGNFRFSSIVAII